MNIFKEPPNASEFPKTVFTSLSYITNATEHVYLKVFIPGSTFFLI